jgi:hypothetical protein
LLMEIPIVEFRARKLLNTMWQSFPAVMCIRLRKDDPTWPMSIWVLEPILQLPNVSFMAAGATSFCEH